MKRNPIARDLRTPKYRPRIVVGKRTYDDWKTTEPEQDWEACPDCGGPLQRHHENGWGADGYFCRKCDV